MPIVYGAWKPSALKSHGPESKYDAQNKE